jgi:cell division protein FtsW
MISRVRRTPLTEWWWTIDRLLLAAFAVLMLAGVVLSLAASPPVATRIGLDSFHFFNRHVVFLVPSLVVLIATSFLSPRYVRRSALIVFCVALALIVATLAFGVEVKGSKRWITLIGISIQPSELAKPAFTVLIAWLFAESAKRPEMPATLIASALVAMLATLLVLQPDLGQTLLVVGVWSVLLFLAGIRKIWIGGLFVLGIGGMFAAYLIFPHVASRFRRFTDPASGDTFQVDTAIESFLRGGWFGQGPGEGTVKQILPDSHTDFVFAVAAEEFGILLCLVLLALFAFVVIRTLTHAMRNDDQFARFAASGLAVLFGAQAAINMAVNLHLIPSKGMTLPFISYGGSSMISMAYGMGMLLALTRTRSSVERESIGDAYGARSFA